MFWLAGPSLEGFVSEQAAVESLEAEPSPSPTGTAGVIQPAGIYTGIRGRGQETVHRNVRGKNEEGLFGFTLLSCS